MTIQLPVLLWTVISFIVLMLLLDKLLFTPLLKFMDARQEKLDRARAARENAVKAREAAARAAADALQAAQKRARDDAQSALDKVKNEAAREAAEREQAYAAKLLQTRSDMEAEREAILLSLDERMDGLVTAFTEKLA